MLANNREQDKQTDKGAKMQMKQDFRSLSSFLPQIRAEETVTSTTRDLSPTVTPYVTLMGELPVVDAFQSHPLNGHLRRGG